jgi:hypothetical protein
MDALSSSSISLEDRERERERDLDLEREDDRDDPDREKVRESIALAWGEMDLLRALEAAFMALICLLVRLCSAVLVLVVIPPLSLLLLLLILVLIAFPSDPSRVLCSSSKSEVLIWIWGNVLALTVFSLL